MNNPWFRKWGIVFIPVSWQGALVTVVAVLFIANIFLAVDARAHSGTDLLYGLFPYWVPTFLLWEWIGSKTCESNEVYK